MALIDISPTGRMRALDATPRSTPIFAALLVQTGIAIRCHHARRNDLAVCLNCGWCPHRRIFREDAGSRNEVQVCEGCGEERHPGRDSF